MISRRNFVMTTAAFGVVSPRISSAQQAESFVLPERLMPQIVRVRRELEPGNLIVSPSKHFLYFILSTGRAMRYGVGVGRAGRDFKGNAIIGRKAKWPSWRPTDAMIEREPEIYARFADGVPGGRNNPLGARALYLYKNGRDTYYRIHGTNEPRSIGRSVSNGCIRMLNEHVIDLYDRVQIGAVVTVL